MSKASDLVSGLLLLLCARVVQRLAVSARTVPHCLRHAFSDLMARCPLRLAVHEY